MKICTLCKVEMDATSFNKNRSMKDGLQSRCKACQVVTNREWAERYPEVRRANHRRNATTRYRGGTYEQRSAVGKLNHAVEIGLLARPAVCPSCEDPRYKVQGHHHDYSKPLDVEWLCAKCHGREHQKLRQMAGGANQVHA